MNKKIFVIIIGFYLFFAYFGIVNAINIGVSPASIKFTEVLRAGYSERNILISTDSVSPVSVEVTPFGEISEWINITVKNITLTKNNPYSLKIILNPPLDTRNGNYSGYLRFQTKTSAIPKEGQAVGTIIPALDLTIGAEVVDKEKVQCDASDYKVDSVEKGDDIIFSVHVANTGNVRLKPKVKLNIWDKNQISIVKGQEYVGQEILPSVGGVVYFRIKSEDLNIDQYFLNVELPECYSSKLLTFDVLEPGALKADGVLIEIKVNKTAGVSETVPIIARFQNTGQKEVDAQFKGKISLGNQIVQVLESEKIKIPTSEVNRFSFYFTPKKPGKYVISGNVFYSNKKTFESSAILNVISKSFSYSTLLTSLIFIIIIFFIIFLFFMIHKERRKYQDKLRRLR